MILRRTKGLPALFGLVFLGGILWPGPPCAGAPFSGLKNSRQLQGPSQKNKSDTLIYNILRQYPELFDSLLSARDELGIQVIYTQIDRSKKGKPVFREHRFNLDSSRYYYPASTVKLPVAILALQRLNELKIAGLDKNTTMITGSAGGRQTEVCNDPSSPDGRPSIAHYIKKILLVSDNDAFNRLYEFLGQEYINHTLQRMGYRNVQILHRLDISLPEEENRFTNPVTFMDTGGRVIYEKAAEKSQLDYASRNTKLGRGYLKDGQLVKEPFDFSKKNRLTLDELNSILKSVLFPESVPASMRFNLTPGDYAFLRRYMSMMPPESVSPVYDTTNYWDTYVKFLYYGAEKGTMQPGLRIFNKPGDAYGFMIDAAYIMDTVNQVEFMLSAVIYCNSDGIFNDDQYDYKKTGLPFMKNLGRVIDAYERTRVRKRPPDFAQFLFTYHD
ncbi:MAG: serine hydrolase [Sphingobacteriales bacterium]|nr:serine hydrolase [Sphingobacteriales bacterium]